jgi:hypothetical protein
MHVHLETLKKVRIFQVRIFQNIYNNFHRQMSMLKSLYFIYHVGVFISRSARKGSDTLEQQFINQSFCNIIYKKQELYISFRRENEQLFVIFLYSYRLMSRKQRLLEKPAETIYFMNCYLRKTWVFLFRQKMHEVC